MATKKATKSKTIKFGLAVTLLGAAQTFLPQVQGLLTPDLYGIITAAIGVTVVGLRYATSEGLLG